MEKKYLYNKQTHALHIRGFCCHAKGVSNYLPFDSEDEAITFDSRASMCKLCKKERDKKLEVLL